MTKSMLQNLWERGFLYAPDKESSNGQEPKEDVGQEPTDSTQQSQDNASQDDALQSDDKSSGMQSLPDWAQELISGLRKENASHRTAKKQAEDDARKAEEKRMADNEEWKKLAEQRQERIGALEPLESQISKLTERFERTLNDEIKDWPDEVKSLAPNGDGEGISVVDMLDWLDKHRPLAAKLMEKTAEPPPKGNGPRPKPKGQGEKRQEPIEPAVDIRRIF